MRDIKFRVWDGKYKKMHYKVLVGNLSDKDFESYTAHSVYLRPGDTDYKIEWPGQWMNFDEHSSMVLQQFMGIKDKNGKDVYEGDVILIPASEGTVVPHLIEWNEAYHLHVAVPLDKTSISLSDLLFACDWDDCEIIGNVFQTPELITN